MLTNDKRRAIHDFIAGTVVVRRDVWEQEKELARQKARDSIGPPDPPLIPG